MRVSCFLFRVKGAVSASLHLYAGNLGQKTSDFNCFDFIHSFGVPSVSNKRKMVVSTTMESQRAYFVRNQRETVKRTCDKTSDWKVRKPCIHLQAWFWTSQLRLRVLEGFWRRLWQKSRPGLQVGCKTCKVSGSLAVTKKASSLKWDTVKHLRFISTRQDELAS